MTVNKKAKLFVFSAPSGSGKTTIVRSLLKYFPELVFPFQQQQEKNDQRK